MLSRTKPGIHVVLVVPSPMAVVFHQLLPAFIHLRKRKEGRYQTPCNECTSAYRSKATQRYRVQVKQDEEHDFIWGSCSRVRAIPRRVVHGFLFILGVLLPFFLLLCRSASHLLVFFEGWQETSEGQEKKSGVVEKGILFLLYKIQMVGDMQR